MKNFSRKKLMEWLMIAALTVRIIVVIAGKIS
jgi:hypothetical protein